jgi:hypothetical protein
MGREADSMDPAEPANPPYNLRKAEGPRSLASSIAYSGSTEKSPGPLGSIQKTPRPNDPSATQGSTGSGEHDVRATPDRSYGTPTLPRQDPGPRLRVKRRQLWHRPRNTQAHPITLPARSRMLHNPQRSSRGPFGPLPSTGYP